MITRKLHQVRYYPSDISYSRQIGAKMRLLPFNTARRIAARLRRSGIAAFTSSMAVKEA